MTSNDLRARGRTTARQGPAEDAVTVETEIAAPPERVFHALTDPKTLLAWWGTEPSVELLTFEMQPVPGGEWRFTCTPRPGHDHGAVETQMRARGATAFEAHGVVLESVPPHLLVWSWIANWHDEPTHQTVVRWELHRTGRGTLVRVTHSGLAALPVARRDYGTGWQGVLRLLRVFLETSTRGQDG
jgi:uncharacterized protein YndB with AHSA1/START domain